MFISATISSTVFPLPKSEFLLQVALLGRGQLVVEDDHVDVERLGFGNEVGELAFPDQGGCVEAIPFQQNRLHRL